jgi:uncharacterized membrane protein YdcZ (DUF606 family)
MIYLATILCMLLVYGIMLLGLCHDRAGGYATVKQRYTLMENLGFFVVLMAPFALAVGAGFLIASFYS